jgi:hypothetical protein
MKRASPTGGALGAISESEMRLLTSSLQSLGREQSSPQLKRNLLAARAHYQNFANKVQGYNPQSEQDYSPAAPAAPAPAQKSYSQTATNPQTGQRIGLNAQGQWEVIP